MPLPDGFPILHEPLPKRRPPPDYTRRGTKLRLFAWLAAIMLLLAVLERGRDPQVWEWLRQGTSAAGTQRGAGAIAKLQAANVERPPLLAENVATPDLAEMLARYGIGPAELATLVDGQQLTPNEEPLLLKALYRFPRLGRKNVHHWRQADVSWEQLAADHDNHRGEVFRVRGRATRVEKVALPAEQAQLYEFGNYYRVTLERSDSDASAVLFARQVPAAWKPGEPLDEPAEADAIFLKLGASETNSPQLLFAADRVAWLPDKLDPGRGIGPAQLALARLGMDIGLWDEVRELNDQPLGTADREAFYQLLAALGQPAAGDLQVASDHRLDLGPLLQQPQGFQGNLMPVTGTARRITRIDVPDADVRERFGIDHYYEIDLFLPLGEASIRLGEGARDGKSPVFHSTFPATLIARRLPPDLTPQDNLHERIAADAVFFKVWTYDSRYAAKFGQVQPAPLFVASEPRLVAAAVESNWFSGLLVGGALGVSLAVLMLVLWWSFRPGRERRFAKSNAPPDFSHLR